MGQKGAHTADVIFENCRVPASQVIGGKEGRGFKTAMKVLEKGRIHIAALAVGAAERMLRDALNYAIERKQFGRPIAEFQLVQAMLADSQAEIYAAKSMLALGSAVTKAGSSGSVTMSEKAVTWVLPSARGKTSTVLTDPSSS
jgi:acyl-CoA dehydrogenase